MEISFTSFDTIEAHLRVFPFVLRDNLSIAVVSLNKEQRRFTLREIILFQRFLA